MNYDNTFKFIEIVHRKECLWKVSNKYSEMHKRNQLWGEVGNQFNLTGEQAYLYFRKLREKYRREYDKENESRSGAGLSAGTKWVFFHHLKFLDESYKKRNRFPFLHAKGSDSTTATLKSTTIKPAFVMAETEVMDESGNTEDSQTFLGSTMSDTAVPTSKMTYIKAEVKTKQEDPRSPSPGFSHSPPSSPGLCQIPASSPSSASMDQVFTQNTRELIKAINAPISGRPHDAVVEFIRHTLTTLEPEKSNSLEKELMEVVFKYRYSN